MTHFNADLTAPIYCLIREEFLHDGRSSHGRFAEAMIIAACSIAGQALSFHVLLRNGALWHRRPIHSLCTKPCDPLPLAMLELWDCFSYDIQVKRYAALKPLRCAAILRDGSRAMGGYQFTVEWCGDGYAEIPDQVKCAHVIALDSGHLCAMPNNRVVWHEPSWITPMTGKPDYLVDTHIYRAEAGADRLIDGERQFYTTAAERPS